MTNKYMKRREFIPRFNTDEIPLLFPINVDKNSIETLLGTLHHFYSVLQKQQYPSTTHTMDSSTASSGYIDSRFILPTANVCERIYSTAVFSFENRRERHLLVPSEQQIF